MPAPATPTLDEIKQALENDAFVFFYQPKISFLTGRITGAEALIRWRKPDGSMVPPGIFIPIAEAAGFISTITERMFPHLMRDYGRVHETAPGSTVAFNVSPTDLERPELTSLIEAALDAGQIPPAALQIEVTEAAAISGSEVMRGLVQRLVQRGVSLAMDDFGTGYASLEALRKLPFSVLKVDQSIVREMDKSKRSATLVQANISLAQVLGVEAVAEGIETEAIYTMLVHSGCSGGQGYYMSRPIPLDDYLALLKKEPVWPHSHAGLLRTLLMDHVMELRHVMDWMYAARIAQGPQPNHVVLPLSIRNGSAFTQWYEGPGSDLRGNRTFEAMRMPHEILSATYEAIRDEVTRGGSPEAFAPHLAKIAHYSVVLIGDLLRLEAELLLQDLRTHV